MVAVQAVVKQNQPLNESVYEMIVACDTSSIQQPGQFVDIRLEGLYLRRPISICAYDDTTITLVYKCVGKGTKQLSEMKVADTLDILVGLGNGYSLQEEDTSILLIGGGVGVPPLYQLAREAIKKQKKVSVIMGFNTKKEVFYEDQFKQLGADVYVTTIDGSYGTKGVVTDVMETCTYDYYYACGPKPMLQAVHKQALTKGQLSLEERMGCGHGACMGCTTKTKQGAKRLCVDGPVLTSEEVLWED